MGPLSLVSTIDELLGRKSSGSGLKSREYGSGDPLRWPRETLYPKKLTLTSPTSGGRSVGAVRSRTKDTEFSSVSWRASERCEIWVQGDVLSHLTFNLFSCSRIACNIGSDIDPISDSDRNVCFIVEQLPAVCHNLDVTLFQLCTITLVHYWIIPFLLSLSFIWQNGTRHFLSQPELFHHTNTASCSLAHSTPLPILVSRLCFQTNHILVQSVRNETQWASASYGKRNPEVSATMGTNKLWCYLHLLRVKIWRYLG
jgi:hypothetical protein